MRLSGRDGSHPLLCNVSISRQGRKVSRFKALLNYLQVLLETGPWLFQLFFLHLTQDARSRLSPPAPLAVWLQQPPTLLLCWKKVKASLLTTDVHMNVRHLPNKCLPKGGLIIIPRVAITSLPLTAAALQQLLLGALTLSLWEHVAGPFSDAQNPEAEDSQTCYSGAVLVSNTHAIQAETTHASQFSRSCHIP